MAIPQERFPNAEVVEEAFNDRWHGFADAERIAPSRVGKTDTQPRRDGAERNRRRCTSRPGAGDKNIKCGAYSALTA